MSESDRTLDMKPGIIRTTGSQPISRGEKVPPFHRAVIEPPLSDDPTHR